MKKHKNSILQTLLILSLMISLSQGQWIHYKTFTGNIPSYTYPINLNAGDVLRVELSWPGPEDLDIYLYYNTMDILSRTLYEDREYSPTYNPEILEYVNYYTDLYYVRVDLYTTVPTAYQIDIYVNGVLQHTYYDTVISVQTGLTTQQFTIDGVCEIRVKYDGPICGVYLFEPGVDVLTGYAVAADLSNTNPKYITQVLTVPGLWTVAVQHQIMSTYGQIPFKIVIETNQGANQCHNYCSGIAYNLGLIPGYTTQCLCADGFIWDSSAKLCLIDCQYFNPAGDIGSRVGGTVDQCVCLNSNYLWNTNSFNCKIDCPVITYSTGVRIDDNTCQCSTGYVWNATSKKCVRDCNSLTNTAGLSTTNINECNCVTNYHWDAVTATCSPNLICGDGFLAGAEQCDDGNTVDGDGCNADCTFGNNNGCASATPYRDPISTNCASVCPSGHYKSTSTYTCPTCSSNCFQCTSGTVCNQCQPGYVVNVTTGSCQVTLCNVSNCISCPTSVNTCDGCTTGYQLISGACQTVCGDNIMAGTQQCDDGNTIDGDGCNADCTTGNNNGCPQSSPYKDPTTTNCASVCPPGYYTVASTFSCSSCVANCNQCTSGSICNQCKPGYIVNTVTGGCDVVPCTAVNCVLCPSSPSVCQGCGTGYQLIGGACQTVCGDNILAGSQQCDDGNTVDGDGCNANCSIGNNNGCPSTTPYKDPLTLICSSACSDGYYSDPAIFSCPSCFYTCATCTNGADCTSCSITSNRYFNGTQCLPNPGYYDNGTTNTIPCISPCSTCTSASACTTCVNTTYLSGTTCPSCSGAMTNCLYCSSSSVCQFCSPGYVVNSATGLCQVSPCTDVNCILCPVSFSTCQGCTIGFQLVSGACQTVCGDNVMAGTEQCDDGNTVDGDGCNADCTTGNTNSCAASSPYRDPVTLTCSSVCPNGYYSDLATFSCLSCFYTCGTCTNSTDCTSCSSSSNRYLNGTQCLPNPGFYDNSTFNATPCTSPCSTCTSASVCTTCQNTAYMSVSMCINCSSAISNCLYCTSAATCDQCQLGFIFNSTTNLCDPVPCDNILCLSCPNSMAVCEICSPGYQANNGDCVTVCGDFVIAGSEVCDDGNTRQFDGCSTTCTVESDFTCQPDLINSAGSECFFIGNVTLSKVYINKVDNQNKVEIKLEFSHSNLAVWDDVNFLDMIKINCAVHIDGYEVMRNADGTVTITVSYAADIQGQPMDITIDPSLTNIPSLSRTTPSTTNLQIIPDDNEAAYFYNESTYKLAGMVPLLSTAIVALAGVLFIAGTIFGKMIAVETMAVVQITFFALLSLNQMNPSFAYLNSLKYANGYNSLFTNSNDTHLEDGLTSTNAKGIFLFSRFAQNFNFTGALILIPLLVALVSFILSKTAFKQNERVVNIAKKAVGEYTLMAILFAGYLVSVSFGLEVMYGIKNMEGLLGTVSIAECGVLLVLTLFYLVFIIKKPQFFGQFTESFKKDSLSSKFYVVMLFERVLVGSLMVFMMSTGFSLAVPLAVFLILGAVVIIRKPHKDNYHTYRFVANMAISAVIMILFIVYSLALHKEKDIKPILFYLPMIICGLVMLSVLINLATLIYSVYKNYKSNNANQLLQQDNAYINKIAKQATLNNPDSPTKLLPNLTLSPTNITKQQLLKSSIETTLPQNQTRKRVDIKQIKQSIKLSRSLVTNSNSNGKDGGDGNSLGMFTDMNGLTENLEDYNGI